MTPHAVRRAKCAVRSATGAGLVRSATRRRSFAISEELWRGLAEAPSVGKAARRREAEGGFTLIESLIAMLVLMVVMAGMFTLFNPAVATSQVEPEAVDIQQRMRVAVTSLYSELVAAGAGTYTGATKGSLNNLFASVLPYRLGTTSSDPASGVYYRSDSITTMYVPVTGPQTSLQAAMTSTIGDMVINTQAGCLAAPVCGFTAGMRAVIFDDTGAFDTFTVTGVSGTSIVQHAADRFSKAYGSGAQVAQLAMHTYYLKTDASSATYQLMHFDGYQVDAPVADNVVAFNVQYFGEAAPPALVRPVTEPDGPWTTYGPKPPAPGIDNTTDNWSAGENCTFTTSSGTQVPRLASLGTPGTLVPLSSAQLSDGPWCPDSAAATRYDADLLRVRKIRVTLRVQTGVSTLRGPEGNLFVKGGTAKGFGIVPDQEMTFDVAPRNLNLSR